MLIYVGVQVEWKWMRSVYSSNRSNVPHSRMQPSQENYVQVIPDTRIERLELELDYLPSTHCDLVDLHTICTYQFRTFEHVELCLDGTIQ